jgi:hypothetical protein
VNHQHVEYCRTHGCGTPIGEWRGNEFVITAEKFDIITRHHGERHISIVKKQPEPEPDRNRK